MRRLIWVSVGRICPEVRFLTLRCCSFDVAEKVQTSMRNLAILTLVLLIPVIPCLCEQCTSRSVGLEANWSGPALFAITYLNLYQQSRSSNMIGWKLEMGVASYFFFFSRTRFNKNVCSAYNIWILLNISTDNQGTNLPRKMPRNNWGFPFCVCSDVTILMRCRMGRKFRRRLFIIYFIHFSQKIGFNISYKMSSYFQNNMLWYYMRLSHYVK